MKKKEYYIHNKRHIRKLKRYCAASRSNNGERARKYEMKIWEFIIKITPITAVQIEKEVWGWNPQSGRVFYTHDI